MDPMQNQPMPAAPSPAPEKKAFGPLIGIVIVIVALVIGAFYFWGQKASQESSSADGASFEIAAVSEGDDLESIEQDLSVDPSAEFDFSDLEAELGE